MNSQSPSATPRPQRPPRLPVFVANQIQDLIVSERLHAGSKLPTEPQLSQQYGVSRQVVREATRLLEDRGLIDVRPGRGMVVAPATTTSISDRYTFLLQRDPAGFDQLMQLRRLVEVNMTGLAATHRTDADLRAMDEVLQRAEAAPTDFDLCLAADLEFHAAVAAATQNPFITAIADPINSSLRQAYREPAAYLAHQREILREHREIRSAIAAGDVGAAEACAQAHLDRVSGQRSQLVG